MKKLYVISSSCNNLMFRPLIWEDFRKMNQGKFVLENKTFKMITTEGKELNGAVEELEMAQNRDVLERRYQLTFDTGLNCILRLSQQKDGNGGFYKGMGFFMECPFNPNFWFVYGNLVDE